MSGAVGAAVAAATLVYGQVFSSAKAFLDSVFAFCKQENKSYKIAAKGGSSYTIVCTDPSCHWLVRAHKPRGHTHFKVSYSNLTHNDLCTNVFKPTSGYLSNNAKLIQFVHDNPDCSRKQVSNYMQTEQDTDLSPMSNSVFYRLLTDLKERAFGDYHATYSKIPPYLSSFCALNPLSSCALQVDPSGRFKRVFVCPHPSVYVQPGLLEVRIFDGAHAKTNTYNPYDGNHLLLVGKDGNMKNILLAFALVPTESGVECAWFIAWCVIAGLQVEHMPLFVDRGPIRTAQTILEPLAVSLAASSCDWV
jgi:hypothetical protein